MTAVYGLGTTLRVRMRTLEDGVQRNGQRAENSLVPRLFMGELTGSIENPMITSAGLEVVPSFGMCDQTDAGRPIPASVQ